MKNQKSVLVAYVLFFLLGFLGVHRLYTGHVGSAIIRYWVLGPLTLGVLTIVFLIIDFFAIPSLCKGFSGMPNIIINNNNNNVVGR